MLRGGVVVVDGDGKVWLEEYRRVVQKQSSLRSWLQLSVHFLVVPCYVQRPLADILPF